MSSILPAPSKTCILINIGMHSFFYKLNQPFTSAPRVLEYMAARPTSDWTARGYGFDMMDIPRAIITDSFYSAIHSKFPLIPHLFRVKARFFYKWHVDAKRLAALNILLINEHSHTVFSDCADQHDNKCNLTELVYEKDGVYLLNTQQQHAVMNLGSDRILLGMSFATNPTYADVMSYCAALGL